MTAYTPIRATHQTLGAGTADSVLFSEPGNAVRVTNRDATQVIYFRIDGTTAVSAAADNYVVPAGVGNTLTVYSKGGMRSKISLISSAGGAYSCETFPENASSSGGGSSGGGAVTNAGTFLVQENGTHVLVDDAAFTPATTKVVMAGFEADETATDSVDEGDGGAARMTLDRKVITTAQGHTAGGLTVVQLNGSDGAGGVLVATSQVVKASAGQLYGYYVYNPNSAATFVHIYNTASAGVTVGTTNPLITITVPAVAAANLTFPIGVAFGTAMAAAATTTAGGNTAPSTGLDVTLFIQ